MATKKLNYYDGLNEEMKLRYDSKIDLCGGIDPYSVSEKNLSLDRTDFPEVTLIDIGNYLVHSVSSFGAKKIGETAVMKGKV